MNPTAPPAEPLPPPAAPALPPRRAWWALPFVLSLVFVVAVAAVLQWSDREEIDEARRVLISDALSLESQLSARIEAEREQLTTLANKVQPGWTAARFAASPQVIDGLRRSWVSVTWIGADARLVAHLPEHADQPERSLRASGADDSGISMHLSAPLRRPDGPGFGHLVARFAPAAMLRASVPWWLAHKYEVRLVDGTGLVVASSGELPTSTGHLSHRISMEPSLPDIYLELVARATHRPWWRTLPLALMLVFLLLVGAATWLLRRQIDQVARAEQLWRTEAAWRRAMEDSLTVGLRARDLDGRLIYANRSFATMVGYSREELIGLLPPMPYWSPDQLEETMWRHRRNMAGQAPREGYEARWRTRDGRFVDALVFEAPLVDAHGRHVGWMASIVNNTERKRLEDNERRQTEAMAHQARLTTLGEIASALAHQLNQPLTAIAGYNAGVLRLLEQPGFDHAMVMQALRRQGEQAAEAGRIVRRIREFLTRRGPQREACYLAETLHRAIELLRRSLQQRHIEVSWALAEDLPLVLADPVLIEQVLINLVRNAGDELVAEDGEGSRAGPRQRQIRISAAPAGAGHVRIDVDDNGPGLRGRAIEQLSSAFYSTKAEGMGMGLAICRSVIEAHHGALDAGPSPLGGARFSFSLPVCPDDAGDSADLLTDPDASDSLPDTRPDMPTLLP